MNRSNPWVREFSAPINLIQDELQRVMTNLRGRGWPDSRKGDAAPAWSPAVDLVETGDAIDLSVDLPGVEPTEIELSVSGNVLTIRGDRPAPPAEGMDWHARERPSGHFVREIPLPSDVDSGAVEARMSQGVLTVHMPKAPAARPHSIPIRPA